MLKKRTFQALMLAFTLSPWLSSCSDDCNNEDPVCKETVPVDQACQAYFSRWFYDTNQNQCTEISYSGCDAKGFESKAACEECLCAE